MRWKEKLYERRLKRPIDEKTRAAIHTEFRRRQDQIPILAELSWNASKPELTIRLIRIMKDETTKSGCKKAVVNVLVKIEPPPVGEITKLVSGIADEPRMSADQKGVSAFLFGLRELEGTCILRTGDYLLRSA